VTAEPEAVPRRPIETKPTTKAAPEVERLSGWPPEPPEGPKPRIHEPNAAEWRYQRYRYKAYMKGKSPNEVLDYDTYVRQHFRSALRGGRPGRMGGKEQVAAKKALAQKEGVRIVENVSLGGKYPDGIRPTANPQGGKDYFEVGAMIKKRMPEARERKKLEAEIEAMNKNDTVTFVDKTDITNRITYRKGDDVNSKLADNKD
jgi:hypothetical protein